ncbi:CaiB/BaiF CoA-transferase family protein [Flavisphingomonas formosensis]|uniref:CaiB/BaiF CoA-transferase family protein n=1 Tax=Flavisphingomonas formosensis TaxID=861534 RepID=UPI0012FCD6A1|nr:CoA transferase [Sphingomonas formosensis]
MSMIRMLDGLKVVDLGVGMAPALAAKMLADLGASVTRIEPAGGDPFAAIYPAYEVWHRGAARAGGEALDALLADADACILGGEDHPDLVRRRDAAALAARHPRLVLLDITDGPAGTRYVGPSTELLAQVRSGLVWEQEPDRPIVNAFEPGSYGAAMQGLIGLLGALFEREASGEGQIVSTSLFEGALPWIGTYWAKLEKPTPMADFVIPRGVAPLIFRTRDGRFIHMAIGGAGSKYGFYQALEIDDPSVLPGDSGMPKPGGSRRDFFGDYEVLAAHVAKKDCDELLARIWERGLPAEEVQTPGACWSDPQVARNGIIVTDPDGTRHVGLPFSAAPLAEGAAKRASRGTAPLSGIRVIDCGAFVAGPLAGVVLADLGADVVKVEAKQGDPNRSIFKSFTVANHSKRVIGVDMKHGEGLRIVQQLCADADVVMNNFRPGVAPRLGVDPASLSAINPALIVLEAPAFGNDGPLALKAGFDMVMQAWTGHEVKAGGTGNEPRWNRTNLVDFAGGMLGSIAILAALLYRERTGSSVALESPLCNAGIYTLSELIQRPDGSFAGVPTLSSSLSGYTPLECLYKAKDGWVAIVARGRRAAEGLRDALALAGDPAAWGEAEERQIAGRVAALDLAAVQALLTPHGIWVEPVRDGKEEQILTDPQLIARGTVRVSRHAAFGQINEIGTAFSLSRSRLGTDLPAPQPGAHTRELLARLGYDETAIGELYERQAVA